MDTGSQVQGHSRSTCADPLSNTAIQKLGMGSQYSGCGVRKIRSSRPWLDIKSKVSLDNVILGLKRAEDGLGGRGQFFNPISSFFTRRGFKRS